MPESIYINGEIVRTPEIKTPLDLEQLTIQTLCWQLRTELEADPDYVIEYCLVSPEVNYNDRKDQPIGKHRWIAIYAVTGGNEGHYIHVDRVYQKTEYAREWTHEGLFLIKTFGGYEVACRIAAYIGRRMDV